jgi:hypothetical protein
MTVSKHKRDIPRVWEVDWAIPTQEGGTLWESYAWLLHAARELGAAEVSIVAATYENLGDLDRAIGAKQASWMRSPPHSYREDGITVHGVSRRGGWHVRGPVLAAWANDDVLADIEARRAPAIAAVATWPDSIPIWLHTYSPLRIGQVRADQESEYSDITVEALDRSALDALNSATLLVNENHSVLSTYEREHLAGILLALHDAGISLDRDAMKAHLIAAGWNSKLVGAAVELAERVADGRRPRHVGHTLKIS